MGVRDQWNAHILWAVLVMCVFQAIADGISA